MRELTPETITDAVLDQMATTSDPRLKEIMASAVKHLHAFARDVNLTPAEWIKGIEFMTAVGKMCTPERQEFILLSDTLGLSALVNGLHDRTAVEDATHTSLLGPFFRENAPELEAGARSPTRSSPGTEVALWGKRHQRPRRAAGERPGVGLADRRRRPLRHPGRCQRHGLSRRLHHRCAGNSCPSAPCVRSATRSPWTARSARWSRRRAAMACGRPTSTSWSARPATANLSPRSTSKATRTLPTTWCSARPPISLPS